MPRLTWTSTGRRDDAQAPKEAALYIAIAIALATVAAAVFAVGATVQSTAVGRAVEAERAQGGSTRVEGVVGNRAMISLLRNPAWLASVGIIVVGGMLHAVGLALAPISIVQPVGVLAIPFAVLIAARRSRQAPPVPVMLAVAVTMLAVLAFVLAAASDGHNAAHIDAGRVAWSALGVGVIAAALGLIGRAGPRWLKCPAWAACGACIYGLASGLLRTDTMLLAQGDLFTWHVFGYTASVLALFALGGWVVQHAHASGPPAVVLGSLTVIDPIVAVVFGMAFLGEGAKLAPLHLGVMVISGIVAAIGVVLLARHHPEGQEAPEHDPRPDLPTTAPGGPTTSREEHTP